MSHTGHYKCRCSYVVIADPIKDLDALLSLPKVDLPPPLAELVAQELEQVSGGGEPIIGLRPRAVDSLDHVPDTDFTQVYPWSRNATLFHYLQRCPLRLVADYDTCLGLARDANALMPKPLPDAEVKGMWYNFSPPRWSFMYSGKYSQE